MLKFLKKYKTFCVVCVLLLLISCIYFNIVKTASSKSNIICIVLDAGHGGRDGGCIGVNGSVEKYLNLKYTLKLKEKLMQHDYKIILTRSNDAGLYNPFSSNKKVSDMNARMDIIKKANPNLVVSIHMNSFADKGVNGANCFYKIDDEASSDCADLIQKSLHEYCNIKSDKAKRGDYFMLNCSYYTSVLIECGFLSNPEEEMKLNSNEYLEQFTDAVANGIFLYLG